MEQLKVISVNVGLPRKVVRKGKTVKTAIFKEPVAGPVRLEKLNFVGDRQADLSVHGGPDKAVYVYTSERYDFWRTTLARSDLNWGAFGENLTTLGLDEPEVNIGDRFQVGTAEVVVTQPRMPCYKLNLKFDRDDMVKLFGNSRFSGFYLAVLKEGQVEAGDPIIRLSQDENKVTVADINRIYLHDRDDLETMRRSLNVAALTEDWKNFFQERIQKILAKQQA